MEILVFSDTHGDFTGIMEAVKKHPKAELIIHCGDGEEEAEDIKILNKNKMVISVKGNCDWCSTLNAIEKPKIQGKQFFITHGHIHNVKNGLNNIITAANNNEADILLFGHTHIPLQKKVVKNNKTMYILNPGSCSGRSPTYGHVTIENNKINTNILNLNLE